MLSEEQINELAFAAGRNQVQREAAKKALVQGMQVLRAQPLAFGQAPDSTVTIAVPSAPVVLCISSTDGLDTTQRNALWPRLDQAKAHFGHIELVTFGRRGGNEDHAISWAQRNKVVAREFAILWVRDNGDGTTRWDGRQATRRREDRLKAYLEQAEQVYSLRYTVPGNPETSRVNAMHGLIQRWHPPAQQGKQPVAPAPAQPDIEGAVSDANVAALGYDPHAAFEEQMHAAAAAEGVR